MRARATKPTTRTREHRRLSVRLVAATLVALAGAAGCARTRAAPPPAPPWRSAVLADHALAGRAFDGRSGAELGPGAVIARLAAARFVLLGEKHDNADHHRLQAWVIEQLVARGRRPAVVLEMLDAGQRDALERQRRERPDDAGGIGDAVGWATSGWPAFESYLPIFEAAVAARLPLAPGGLSRDTLRRLAAPAPALAADAEARALRAELGLDTPLAPDRAAAMAREIERAHCGMAPAAALPRMVEAQRARDAALARAVLEAGAAGGDGVVLIAGAGHTRGDRGVSQRLAEAGGAQAAASVAFVEVQGSLDAPLPALDAEQGAGPHDVVWLTPRATDADPCAQFREELRRLDRKR
jgi:uncharacterized iron-regulated protein